MADEHGVRLGRLGEAMASLFLQASGYAVLAERYRRRGGEVDLVARRAGLVLFVEVKTRRTRSCGAPEEAVTPAKLRRLRTAARRWLAEHPQPAGTAYRLDVVAIEVLGEGRGARLRHLAGVG